MDRVLGRGDESDAYEKEAFSLAEGAVSQVIHADDAYYVLKCTDDYDEDETAARKERIYEGAEKRAFRRSTTGSAIRSPFLTAAGSGTVWI